MLLQVNYDLLDFMPKRDYKSAMRPDLEPKENKMDFPMLRYWKDVKYAAESDQGFDKSNVAEISNLYGKDPEAVKNDIEGMRKAIK